MGGSLSIYPISNDSLVVIKSNYFLNNLADFGAALNLDHRDSIIYVEENFFETQKNLEHIIGGGTCIKSAGFWNSKIFTVKNIYYNSYSISAGAIVIFGNEFYMKDSKIISIQIIFFIIFFLRFLLTVWCRLCNISKS